MNIVKLSSLNDYKMVNEKKKRNIKGMTKKTLTLGTAKVVPIFIKEKV